MRLAACVILLLTAVGCARYEYIVDYPPEAAGLVPAKEDRVVDVPPLTYRFQEYSQRLVVRVYNGTSQPVELAGDRSVLVDPTGESRRLASQAIAPASFMKLILPPLKPRVHPAGPTITFGVGYSTGGPHDYGGIGWHDHHPHGYVVDDPAGVYWDWPADGVVRLTLVYRIEGKEVTHELRFTRRKKQ